MASSSRTGMASNDDDQISYICGITQCTPQQAAFYLDASHGNAEGAVNMFYEQEQREEDEDSEEEAYPPEHALNSGHDPLRDREQVQQAGQSQGRRWLNPLQVVQMGLQLAFRTVYVTSSVIGNFGVRVLPRSVLHSIQGNLRRIAGEPAQPQIAAANLVHHFRQQYGELGPQWQEESWSDSTRLAHTQFKFLYVYLHSPHHQDTESFCRETLCDLEFSQYVNATFVCWAGDITQPDAHRLAHSLRVTGYPYNALLAFSGSRVRLIAAAQGAISPTELLGLLRTSQDQQHATLIAEQADQNEQNLARRLRQEQDDDYQRSLQADMQKDRQRQEEARQKDDERRAAEEAAAQERAVKDQEKQRVADRASTLRNRHKNKASALGDEPSQGSPNSIHLRVRLPDGRNYQRRFLATDSMQKAYDFVDSLESLDVLKYSLASSYPRRVFSEETLNRSFQELGLSVQATLFVQSQDD